MVKKNYKKLAKQSVNSVNVLDAVSVTPDEESKVSLPPTLKPDAIHGRTVGGTIEAFTPFKGKGFKGTIITMKHESGTRFAFPMTGVIRCALARFVGEEQENFKGEKAVGLHLSIKGLGKGTTKDGKRPVNLFDVYIRKP